MPGRVFESSPDLRIRTPVQRENSLAVYLCLWVLEQRAERGKDLPIPNLTQEPDGSKAPTERHVFLLSMQENLPLNPEDLVGVL
jgi:hypothetical protein